MKIKLKSSILPAEQDNKQLTNNDLTGINLNIAFRVGFKDKKL